ncbi:MAG: YdiU family protein [Planctomycetota bacterium]
MTSQFSSADSDGQGWNLESSYCALPEVLFKDATPAEFFDPKLCLVNHTLAQELGLDFLSFEDNVLAQLFSGQLLPETSRPIAQAYAGHQFGGFTTLGDGRAHLLGEHRTPSGRLVDVQFKGSGVTPFSRSGDGLAALGPMLREYIISEAMHALGIPSTRSLAVVTTGQPVYRETVQQGAVLTRVASSHIRVGTFQYLAAIKDPETLKQLADYTIDRHYPDLADASDDRSDKSNRYLLLLARVIDVQAALVAKWQLVGFIHGVMNTDNMAIGGDTIDYGPCAFMDRYHPGTVFSSIDHGGRYAYANQPPIAQWNLARFAETLIPLLDEDQERAIEVATDALHQFPELHESYWLDGMRQKLGFQVSKSEDRELVDSLLAWMETAEVDFTNTFDDLSTGSLSAGKPGVAAYQQPEFKIWFERWQSRLQAEGMSEESARDGMLQANPAVIPRNHRVEEALAAAVAGDLGVMERLMQVLLNPFARNDASLAYRDPPPPNQCDYKTFCGT